MKKEETCLKDCYVLVPNKFGDNRGYYSPFYIEEDNVLNELSMKSIAQGARSVSAKGIVRGLHFQEDPVCQSKLIECLRGAVLDVVVDLRKDSPSYKKWFSIELTPENGKQLFIPRGFAHGFVSLKDDTMFQYLVDSDYRPSHENGILWNDPEINIDWQFKKYGIENPLLSSKDQVRKPYSEIEHDPNFYMHKRYLVTGCNGQLGYEVVRELNSRGIYDILALDVDDMDITDKRIVNKIITEYAPEYIFHCAAYTAVDKAEENKELAEKINVEGTRNIAESAKSIGAKLFYISTDYVFDGTKNSEYNIDDITNPKSVYGITKRQGEIEALKNEKTFVVRTAWVFGINGNNFIKTMLKLSENHDTLTVVNDQIGSPTYTVDLAKLLVDMSETEKYGIYQATNSGHCSWAEFASYILKDTNTKVIPVTTEEYYAPQYDKAEKDNKKIYIAYRPKNSILSKQKLSDNGFNILPDWHNAVDRYKNELLKRDNQEKDKIKKLSL